VRQTPVLAPVELEALVAATRSGDLSPFMGLRNAERRGCPTRGRFAPRYQLGRVSTRPLRDLRRRRVGRPAVKGRLRRVGDLKLDELGGRAAAHLGGELKGGVDPGGRAGGEDPIPSTTTRSSTGIAPK
jgi:hypothetical protein